MRLFFFALFSHPVDQTFGPHVLPILIDEFQDTSMLQWHNFIPLIENSLATNEFNMLVGDGKQAI